MRYHINFHSLVFVPVRRTLYRSNAQPKMYIDSPRPQDKDDSAVGDVKMSKLSAMKIRGDAAKGAACTQGSEAI